ncbi:MAG: diadenylate cyclase CdaA [Armatimonadota bacterium]|nr:diadenylate cyclase CdaA [Armatimonadota bacterium]
MGAGLAQQAATTFLSIDFLDVLDILVVAYIVYRGLLLLQGTRGGSVIRGMMVVVVLLFLLSLFELLPTLNWILAQLLLPGVLALVVIFQPELRMALDRLGRAGVLGFNLSRTESATAQRVINDIVDAAEEMSDRHIGALMVLQRDSGLMDITRTGKTLNARVSVDALVTVFWPNTPLHDGAAVIRDDLIVAAGCVLPHSERPGLSVATGMRHRAALGLSERTDAAVVVVSEETGAVSLAVDGNLSPDLERTELAERLNRLFESPDERSKLLFWRR